MELIGRDRLLSRESKEEREGELVLGIGEREGEGRKEGSKEEPQFLPNRLSSFFAIWEEGEKAMVIDCFKTKEEEEERKREERRRHVQQQQKRNSFKFILLSLPLKRENNFFSSSRSGLLFGDFLSSFPACVFSFFLSFFSEVLPFFTSLPSDKESPGIVK